MMRISVMRDDSGYANWLGRAGRVLVLVDGKLVEKIHTADEELGKAWGYALNEHGQTYVDPDDPGRAKPAEYAGHVEIKIGS